MNIIKWVFLFIWQLPQNLIALIMLPFLGKKELLCIKRKCFVIFTTGMAGKGSISLGNFIFMGEHKDESIAHELGHVVDSHKFGLLYLFIIGIPSGLWALFDIYKKKQVSYYSLYTERWANRNSHLYDKNIGLNYYPYMYYILKFKEGYSLRDIL